MPKTFLEVSLAEWAATREKLLNIATEKTAHDNLLDAIFEAPAETGALSLFKAKVKDELNLDLDRLTPAHPDSLDSVIREINAIRSVIDDIDAFLDDAEYDPYCEDVYHEDDPRLTK